MVENLNSEMLLTCDLKSLARQPFRASYGTIVPQALPGDHSGRLKIGLIQLNFVRW
jgi:hypothetical protein